MFGLIGQKPIASDSFLAPITDRVVHLAKSGACVVGSVSCLALTILASAASVGTAFQFDSLNEKCVSLWKGTQDNVFGIAAHLYGVLTPSGADDMLKVAQKDSKKIKDPQNIFEHLHNALQHPAVEAVTKFGSSHPLIKKVAMGAGGFFGWRMGIISARTAFVFTLLPSLEAGWLANLALGYGATKYPSFPSALYTAIDGIWWSGDTTFNFLSKPISAVLLVLDKVSEVSPLLGGCAMTYVAWKVGNWWFGEDNLLIQGLSFATALPVNVSKASWKVVRAVTNEDAAAWRPRLEKRVSDYMKTPSGAYVKACNAWDVFTEAVVTTLFGEQEKTSGCVEGMDEKVYHVKTKGSEQTVERFVGNTWTVIKPEDWTRDVPPEVHTTLKLRTDVEQSATNYRVPRSMRAPAPAMTPDQMVQLLGGAIAMGLAAGRQRRPEEAEVYAEDVVIEDPLRASQAVELE